MVIYDRKAGKWIRMTPNEYNQMVDELHLLEKLVWSDFYAPLHDKAPQLTSKQLDRIDNRMNIISMHLVFSKADIYGM